MAYPECKMRVWYETQVAEHFVAIAGLCISGIYRRYEMLANPALVSLQLFLPWVRPAVQQAPIVLLHMAVAPPRVLRNGLPMRYSGMHCGTVTTRLEI